MKTLTLLSLTLISISGICAHAQEQAHAQEPAQAVAPLPAACSYAFIGNYSDAEYEAQLKEYVTEEMTKIACAPVTGATAPKYTLEFDFNVSGSGIGFIRIFNSADGMRMREEISYSTRTRDRKKVSKALLQHVEELIQQVEGHEGKRRPRANEEE